MAVYSSFSYLDIAGIIEGANDGRGRGRQGMSDPSLIYRLYSIINSTVIAGMTTRQASNTTPHP